MTLNKKHMGDNVDLVQANIDLLKNYQQHISNKIVFVENDMQD